MTGGGGVQLKTVLKNTHSFVNFFKDPKGHEDKCERGGRWQTSGET